MSLVEFDFMVTANPNPKVKQRWLPLGLSLKYEPVYDAAREFVSSQGCLKYLTPQDQKKMDVVTIDDDKKDYEPADKYGKTRIHACIKAILNH